MKFHTDEHISLAVSLGLRRRGLEVTTTKETGLLGASDDKQVAFALRESRVMVTPAADMLRLASVGTPHAGVAYCHNQKYKVGQLLRKLLALANRIAPEEMVGRIEFL